MNERIRKLAKKSGFSLDSTGIYTAKLEHLPITKNIEKFAESIIEETLKQVDERVYSRGENQWYYEDDKKWVRLHFGYGDLTK